MIQSLPIKECSKCGQIGPVARPNKGTWCRGCTTQYYKDYRKRLYVREKNLERGREAIRGGRWKQIQVAWQTANRHRYVDKMKARRKLRQEIAMGRMVKPTHCSRCGTSILRIEGHHPDYEKPLEVIWLCSICHRGWNSGVHGLFAQGERR